MWESWGKIKEQFECARENNDPKKLERIENSYKKLRKEMV